MDPALVLIALAVVWNGLILTWVVRYYDPETFASSPEQRVLDDDYEDCFETGTPGDD